MVIEVTLANRSVKHGGNKKESQWNRPCGVSGSVGQRPLLSVRMARAASAVSSRTVSKICSNNTSNTLEGRSATFRVQRLVFFSFFFNLLAFCVFFLGWSKSDLLASIASRFLTTFLSVKFNYVFQPCNDTFQFGVIVSASYDEYTASVKCGNVSSKHGW